jgi:hypothetical protein
MGYTTLRLRPRRMRSARKEFDYRLFSAADSADAQQA